MTRRMGLEMPIFTYAEFMIRSAEALFDEGDVALAIALSERANQQLVNYARSWGSSNKIPRPSALNDAIMQAAIARVNLAFICGHEIAHLLQRADTAELTPFFDAIETVCRKNEMEPHNHIENAVVSRFFKPDTTQKFDDDGLHDGDRIEGVRHARNLQEREARLIDEVQADALGMLGATWRAIEFQIEPRMLLSVLMSVLEHTELYSITRKLLPQLPRGSKRCQVTHPQSKLVARQITLWKAISEIRIGNVPVPPQIKAYWLELDTEQVDIMEEATEDQTLEQLALFPSILTRGAVHLGLQGSFGEAPSEEDVRNNWGPLAGDAFYLFNHLNIPECFFKLSSSYQLKDDELHQAFHRGYAAAVFDIVQVKSRESRAPNDIRYQDILRHGTDDSFLEALRSVRSQIFYRKLDANWANGFEDLLIGT